MFDRQIKQCGAEMGEPAMGGRKGEAGCARVKPPAQCCAAVLLI